MSCDSSATRQIKRVAVVRGGAWDSTQAGPRTVQCLLDMGFEVTAYGWDYTGKLPSIEKKDGFVVKRYGRKMPKAGAKFFLSWPFWWKWLKNEFLQNKYDYVHVMNLDCVIPAVRTRRRAGHRIVYDIRDAWGLCLTAKPFPLPQMFTWLDRVFSDRVDGLLLSQGMLDYCARYHGKKAAKTVPVVQVLNVPAEDIGARGYRPAGSGESLTLNYSGRISAFRGAYTLPEAIKGTPWKLHVYGKCPDQAIHEYLAAAEATHIDGIVPLEQSLAWMDAEDLLSLWYDPCMKVVFIASANKMFEAMMLGKPYVCTEGSFPGFVARKFELGWEVPYGDIDAMRTLLKELAAHPERLREAGNNGRRAYEEHFQWHTQKKNMTDLYRYLEGDMAIQPRPVEGWDKFIGTSLSL